MLGELAPRAAQHACAAPPLQQAAIFGVDVGLPLPFTTYPTPPLHLSKRTVAPGPSRVLGRSRSPSTSTAYSKMGLTGGSRAVPA